MRWIRTSIPLSPVRWPAISLFHVGPTITIHPFSLFCGVHPPPPLICHSANSAPSPFPHVERLRIPSTLNLSHCKTDIPNFLVKPPPPHIAVYSVSCVSETQGLILELGVTNMLLLCMTKVLPKVICWMIIFCQNVCFACYLLSLSDLEPDIFF